MSTATADVVYTDNSNSVRATTEGDNRDRWSSRVTFILGAIGSAVGLGNLWRFPYLTYKYGGGTFLIPYIIAFFVFGVPLCFLELTLGRNFQGGDPVCFNSMHRRLSGIGWMSTYGSFLVCMYYCVVIGWCVIYFFQSFQKDLPWAGVTNTSGVLTVNAETHFYGTVLQLSDGIMTQETTNYQIPLATMFVWICVFLSIYKGVGVVSKVVKFSVPVPIMLLVVLLINSCTKEGAADGIHRYIGTWDTSKLSDPGIWQEATGQIFFSVGVCFGVMTAYSSYVENRKGLLGDTIAIASMNSLISLLAGFVVFSAVGVLAFQLGIEDWSELTIAGPGLVFVSYPFALAEMGVAPQFFCVLFFLTIFLLAIDSAFSIVEAIVTAMHDTNMGQTYQREHIVAFVCVMGYAIGIFITFDNGLYILDIVDFFLNNFIMLGVGAMECMAATWVYGHEESKSAIGIKSLNYFVGFFGVASLLFLTFFNAITTENNAHITASFVSFFVLVATGVAFAYFHRNPDCDNFWYELTFSGGAKKMCDLMISGEYRDEVVPRSYFLFVHFWAIMSKYFIPLTLFLMMSAGMKKNFESPYEGYPGFAQNAANFEVVVAYFILVMFMVTGVDMYSGRSVVETEKGFQVEYHGNHNNNHNRVEPGTQRTNSADEEAELKKVAQV